MLKIRANPWLVASEVSLLTSFNSRQWILASALALPGVALKVDLHAGEALRDIRGAIWTQDGKGGCERIGRGGMDP